MKLLHYTRADGVEVIVDVTTNWDDDDFYAEARPRGEVLIVFRDGDGEDKHTITARTTMQQVTNAILELSAGNTIAVLWPKDEVVEIDAETRMDRILEVLRGDYPTLLDVARMRDPAPKKTARQGSPQGGLDGPNG